MLGAKFRGGGRQFIKVAAKASSGNFTYLKALIPQGMRIDEIRGLVVGNDPDFKALRLLEFSQSSNGRRFTGSQEPPDHYKSHGHGCFILLVNTLCQLALCSASSISRKVLISGALSCHVLAETIFPSTTVS